jgi:hypothetical protein
MAYLNPELPGVKVVTGTTWIDDSEQTETTPWTILTIAPGDVEAMQEVEVWLDLAKATNGYAAVETSATIQFAVARKVDGTNWRREAYNEAALSGTNAANRMQKINVGKVTADEQVRIMAVMSADATADIAIPFAVVYKARHTPTITPVIAA